jgi:hypothetical protein
MDHATYAEYQAAKNDIIGGIEYREQAEYLMEGRVHTSSDHRSALAPENLPPLKML